jgi:hypothetical protein
MSIFRKLNQDDQDEIRSLLIGRTVKVVGDDTLKLDNGVVLSIEPNFGCGGCPSGSYGIDELNDVPNVITSVKFKEKGHSDVFKIFVYSETSKIKMLEVSGDEGNGYYGYGYTISVTKKDKKKGKKK